MALLDLSDTVSTTSNTDRKTDRPQAFHLGGAAMLIVWDVPEPMRTPASLSVADAVVAPTASLRLPREDGGTRLLWALRRPERVSLKAVLSADALGLSAELSLAGDAPLPALDAAALLDDLEDQAGATLISTLLGLWSGLFRLQRNPAFLRNVNIMLRRLEPSPQPAAIVARELDVRLIESVCIASYHDYKNQGELRVLKDIAPSIKAIGDGTGKGVLVVDDLTDTGKTAKIVRDMLPNAHFATVYAKPAGRPMVETFVTEVSQDTWIYFPWDMGLAYQAPIREGSAG